MLNDKDTTELISQSLHGALTDEQRNLVEEEISRNEQSRAFAKLSGLIQESLSDVAARSASGDESIGPALPKDSQIRMKELIRAEQLRKSSLQLQETFTPENDITAITQGISEETHRIRRVTADYQVLRKLGEGGLGTVWLARDERLKRNVALKEMTAEATEIPRAWDRFHREAEITGHLEHPNIVPLYQFGNDSNTGQPFYAMRFVGKRTLVDAIEEYHDKRLAGEDVSMEIHKLLTAFIGVCQAIAYAHSRGVIHRDLKPENIALDNFGQVIVLDWGLAKVTSEFEGDGLLRSDLSLSDSSLTQTLAGEFIGTPLYMAPEQAAGDLDKIDHRTDVYGLGAILFAMLTGNAPHEKSSVGTDGSVSIPGLLKKIATGPSPRPQQHATGLPADLEAICAKAMQFKQHSRYQSVMELADAVQRWMAGRNERRQVYANARGEGRELRTSMVTSVRDLERNVRFMANLPPIQGIINAKSDRQSEDYATWRERLALIFKGLLRTNGDFCCVSYCEVTDSTFTELVRIERQSSDSSNVRSIPGSRLASGQLTACMQAILAGNPDEVHVSLSSECPDYLKANAGYSAHLAAGVPVFDAVSEEAFGFVLIESGLDRLVESQIRNRFRETHRLYVLDNDCRILLQLNRDGSRVRDLDGQPMNSVRSCWDDVLPVLKEKGEFIDEQDHAVYATRVDLVPGKYSLALVLGLAANC